MKNIALITIMMFIHLYANETDLQILKNIKPEVLHEINNTQVNEEELDYAKFKNFTISADSQNNIIIEVKVLNDKQYTNFGKKILLKDIAVPLTYLFFQEKTNCKIAEQSDFLEKGKCHNLASSYIYDKYIIFKLGSFSIKGKNMRKDFYINANDLVKIKKLKKKKINWFLK